MNALDLMPCGSRLLAIQLRGGSAGQSPLRAVHNRHHHLQIERCWTARCVCPNTKPLGCWLVTGRVGAALRLRARRVSAPIRPQREWVSRRLALVEVLPEAIQQQVREGKIPAQVARQNLEDCQWMAAIFTQYHCDTREAGQLMLRGAKVRQRSANAFSMIPSCFSKHSGKCRRRSRPRAVPNCCVIWRW